MAALVLSPANPAIEQGESVDITVAVDTHVNRYRFRDANTPPGTVYFVPSKPEDFSGWDDLPDAPLTVVLLESSTQHAIFRITWPT